MHSTSNIVLLSYSWPHDVISVPVVSVAIQASDDLPGHGERMLRGVRHLQLHELPSRLPSSPVSPPRGRHRRQASDKTPLSILSALLLDHGNVGVKPQTKHLFPFCLLYSWTMGT